MKGRLRARLGGGLLASLLLGSLFLGGARGQTVQSLPATEQPARVVAGQLRVRVLGVVIDQQGRLGARRSAARRRALARARLSLHRWLDEALARRGSSPALVSRLHALLSREAHVLGSRPLIDGSIVLLVGLPIDILARAGAPELTGSGS
ncbi:MAG: hypothetical protein GXP55_23505 [Deltaproteobacteria bacterium]|nr:hypothetical protein [Deltaproteobacteria bacterium]